jgi:hypothetical protein
VGGSWGHHLPDRGLAATRPLINVAMHRRLPPTGCIALYAVPAIINMKARRFRGPTG